MDSFTVAFFGHRQLEDPFSVEEKLEKIVADLLLTKEYVEFLVGRDGEFDRLAASLIRKCKKEIRNDNSALVLVLPYMTAEYRENPQGFHAYYDEVEICPLSERAHFKRAHELRNRSMVERADLLVFCVQHPSGGAYTAMSYAKKTAVPFLSLDPAFQ